MSADEWPRCLGFKKGACHPEVVADVLTIHTPAVCGTVSTPARLQRWMFQFHVLHAGSKMAAALSLYVAPVVGRL